jgi:hypothetical protein
VALSAARVTAAAQALAKIDQAALRNRASPEALRAATLHAGASRRVPSLRAMR